MKPPIKDTPKEDKPPTKDKPKVLVLEDNLSTKDKTAGSRPLSVIPSNLTVKRVSSTQNVKPKHCSFLTLIGHMIKLYSMISFSYDSISIMCEDD